MAEILSPSPWTDRQDDLRQNPQTDERDISVELTRDEVYSAICDERDRIISFIEETAQRYSRGSVTRVALDNLALEIRERS
jgi:hypothetical protein